ncbi:unnamed protein product (mitochondrion) [Plasmodiophora brassicae]|uniref:Peptidase M1 leukotriene A4 hydrolase/aminopeptidase C-terminal domain-containing protein n=1 Tax=Plasmodiophora brassicae TaxID=37360 RepID=A0A3P3Y2H5_PLABS|nr:unnamed protein product [Plasmodiophora brassicae]
MKAVKDPSSLANVDAVRVRHMKLVLSVDFSCSVLAGQAVLACDIIKDGTSEIVLDTRHLIINEVWCNEKVAQFSLGDELQPFGRPLRIQLPEEHNASSRVTTSSGYPFCFTQCQAIHARSMLPCQDTPMNKSTYDAEVTVDPPLVALMSALSKKPPVKSSQGVTYYFDQQVPMPSYLIALAVGNLQSKEIGPRSSVWAEPDVVAAAASDFSETESFLKAAESICGRYVWGRYDVLVLPPSFPYGGMENPCLTFVTPTLLTGDKSLANVVAHEIAHSWHGNLVTNVTWEHFWLNEGFTVYVERKIMGAIHGDAQFHFQAIGGWKHLMDDIEHFGAQNPLTNLCPDLTGIDPDDAFSSVPYEKGFNLLFYLENLFGRHQFESFLQWFIARHQFSTVDTDDFITDVRSRFAAEPDKLTQIDWNAWLHTPGMPPVEPNFDQSMQDVVKVKASCWVCGNRPDLSSFTAGQRIAFLDQLLLGKAKVTTDTLIALDDHCKFRMSKNAEIRFRWYTLCIQLEHAPILDQVIEFITKQGRMKFVRPLYRDLFKSKFGSSAAVETFKHHRHFYHPIAEKMISHDLHLS